jgi:O-antigen/teichoic acid export membrane protein
MRLNDPSPYQEELGVLSVDHRVRKFVVSAGKSFSWARVRQAGVTITDQVLSVGGMFLVNVVLARTQSRQEYGLFALSYSIFTFLMAIHNAAILETFTVYGSGRYQKHYQPYFRLLWRSNILLGLGLTAVLTTVWALLRFFAPSIASRTILGLAISCGILLSATFVRRAFYVRRRPDLAARFSFVFFCSCVALLWITFRFGVLDGFFGFVIAALSWSIAGLALLRELPGVLQSRDFIQIEPSYWSEHWKYSRWVLVTAFVFQMTTQGYFWIVAGLLSVAEVGNLRALYNVVLPLDQLFAAMSLVVLPVMCSRYARGKMAGLVPLWRRYCLGWFATASAFVVAVYLCGRPVMHLLYAGRFDNISSLVLVIAFLPLVLGTGHTVNGALKAAEKPDLVFYAYAFSGAATFSLGIPLVIRFGLRGAVYGMLVSGAAYTVALLCGFAFLVYGHTRSQRPSGSLQVREKTHL